MADYEKAVSTFHQDYTLCKLSLNTNFLVNLSLLEGGVAFYYSLLCFFNTRTQSVAQASLKLPSVTLTGRILYTKDIYTIHIYIKNLD